MSHSLHRDIPAVAQIYPEAQSSELHLLQCAHPGAATPSETHQLQHGIIHSHVPFGSGLLQQGPSPASIPLGVPIHGHTVSGAPAWPHAQPGMVKVYLLQDGLIPQHQVP